MGNPGIEGKLCSFDTWSHGLQPRSYVMLWNREREIELWHMLDLYKGGCMVSTTNIKNCTKEIAIQVKCWSNVSISRWENLEYRVIIWVNTMLYVPCWTILILGWMYLGFMRFCMVYRFERYRNKKPWNAYILAVSKN